MTWREDRNTPEYQAALKAAEEKNAAEDAHEARCWRVGGPVELSDTDVPTCPECGWYYRAPCNWCGSAKTCRWCIMRLINDLVDRRVSRMNLYKEVTSGQMLAMFSERLFTCEECGLPGATTQRADKWFHLQCAP